MSISVKRALQLEAFRECRLLTGPAGLENEIRWVNILEILDDLRHIEAGEFLITTAYGFNFQDEARQQRLIELFSSSRLAALAVQTGHYIHRLPDSFLEKAARYHIPVIEIPPDLSFKKLTRALLGELARHDLTVGKSSLGEGEKEGTEALIRGRRELMKLLLAGEKPALLKEQLRKLQISSEKPYYLVALKALQKEELSSAFINNDPGREVQVELALSHLLLQLNLPFLTEGRNFFLAFLIQPPNPEIGHFKALAAHLLQELSLLFPRLLFKLGVSNRHNRLESMGKALAEAEKALQAAELGLPGSGPVFYNRLGPYRLLLEVNNDAALAEFVRDTVGPLLDYDRKTGGPLLNTLQVYLEYLNISKAAAALYVHRHTLRYRLRQIESLTGFMLLNNPAHAYHLHLGLVAYNYLKARELL